MINRHYKGTDFITGLRAVAVIMVFLIHSGGAGLRSFGFYGNQIVDFGQYGVEIFFVISGFTIFYQIFSKNYNMKDFIVVRLLRVSMPYFPIIILLFLLSQYGFEYMNIWNMKFNDGIISFENVIMHMFYISFIDLKYANSIIGVEWTLAIEVFYYFLIAIFIFQFQYLSSIKSAFIFFLILSIFSISLIFLFRWFDFNPLYLHWLPLKYGYMFLLGGLAFYLRKKFEQLFSQVLLHKMSNILIFLSPFVLIVFVASTKIINIGVINELFFAVMTFLFIIFIRDTSVLSFVVTNKIMIFIGSISFSFYLIHYIVLTILKKYINVGTGELFITAFFATIILSFVWYTIFENKIYKLLKKYYLGISK